MIVNLKKMFRSLSKILNPFRSHPANLLLAFVITWIYVLLVVWITSPLVETGTFEQPESWQSNIHYALLVPGYIFMLYQLISHMDFLEGFRFLFFPLLTFSLFSRFFVLALGGGYTASRLLLFFLYPLMVVIIPGSFLGGLVLDIPVFIQFYKHGKK